MKRIISILFMLINLSFTVNAQRQISIRPKMHTNKALKPIRSNRPPRFYRLKNKRHNRIDQEIILVDTLRRK